MQKVHRVKDVRNIKIMNKFPLVLLNEKWPVSVSFTEVLEVMVPLGVLYGYMV